MKIVLILLASLFVSCSENPFDKDNTPKDPVVPRKQDVENKRTVYFVKSKKQANGDGFVHGGDGMLFTCLRYVAGASGIHWKRAHVSGDPYWMIRKRNHEPSGEKWSYYSNDMLVGEIWCAWMENDLEWVENRIQWLEDHDWDHCGGREYAEPYMIWKTRCNTSWNLKATYYELQYQLGGDDHPDRLTHVQVWNPWSESFPTHLTMLQMLLRGIMQNGINDNQLKFVAAKVRDNPDNSLYQCILSYFTDGDMSAGVFQLLDERYFPKDHLPTSDNYCTGYLFQREQYENGHLNDDWMPCPKEDKTHDGTDFLFASAVCLGVIK